MREPWFVATLIGAVGTIVWVALCVIGVLLYRRCQGWKAAKKSSPTGTVAARGTLLLLTGDNYTSHQGWVSEMRSDFRTHKAL